jgi:hypothetical protein
MDVMKTDFKNILKTEMESCGYTVDANTNFMDLCIAYGTLRARRVQTQVRNVHTPKNFFVPPELQVGFNLLQSKFKQGVNVNPHLSRSIKYSDSLEDLLFFDWGITHFHLGTSIEADGFIARTKPLLFAIVTLTDVYFIKIANHGNWSDKELLEIVDANWPELIERYRIDGEPVRTFSSEEIGELRKAHVNTMIKLSSDRSYISPGGGLTSAGTSTLATKAAIDIVHRFSSIYKNLNNHLSVSVDDDMEIVEPIKFSLELQNDVDIMLKATNYKFEEKILTLYKLPR